MKKKYDLIIIGAGLSSLMFLNQYLKKTSEQKILLIEQKDKINSDQTFCVWEGPGLPSISENFQLKPKKIWNNIVLNSFNDQIKRHVKPYSYVCFDGKETLESLLSTCKEKIKVIKNEKVVQISCEKKAQIVTTENSVYYSNLIVDSRNNIKPHEIKSPVMQQAFVGDEIELTDERFEPDDVTLMSFKKNDNEIEFTYILPFSKKRALIETTVFTQSPRLGVIEEKHRKILNDYGPYKKIRQEKAIIPMAVVLPDEELKILKIGAGAGMIRGSSGYSMRRIANWAIKLKPEQLNESNLPLFRYHSNGWLNWLDKIFLNVIFKYPDNGPYIFMMLFRRAKMPSLIRFLSDIVVVTDLINILLCMPKRLMLKGLIKKKNE
jgi:lycopene beta-cyclase